MRRSAMLATVAALALAAGCERAAPPPPAAKRAPVVTEPLPLPPPPPAPAPAPPAPRADPPPAAAPIRVLYVEDSPRWEFQYLTNLLVREPSFRTWTLLLDADPQAPQRRSPGLAALDPLTTFASREALAEFDVVVLGDVDPRVLGASPERTLTTLRDFVTHGGGLVLLAGAGNMPSKYAGTPLEALLPFRLDRAMELAKARRHDVTYGLEFHVTAAGETCAYVDIAGDPTASRSKWETSPNWKQYWIFPAAEPTPGAQVLLEVSEAHRDPLKTLPAVVSSTFGAGRVLYVGVDELWRNRYDVGDRYYGAFWLGAVRWLAAAPR